MKLLLSSLVLFLLAGCAAVGTVDLEKKTLTLKGWGSREFTWEEEGVKASIKRGEPIACPTTIPIIK